MTAKEKLLREVLELDESEAAAAKIVTSRDDRADAEFEALLDTEADEVLVELDASEQGAGSNGAGC